MSQPVRRFVCAVTAASALLASAAPAALAQAPVEVSDEATGLHCGAGSAHACDIHLAGTSVITAHVGDMEFVVSTCIDELEGTISETGGGAFTGWTHSGTGCTRTKCNGVGESPFESVWPFQIVEDGAGSESLWYRLCVDFPSNPNGVGDHCDVQATITSDDHGYTVAALDNPCAPRPGSDPSINGEIDGSWTIEDGLEISH